MPVAGALPLFAVEFPYFSAVLVLLEGLGRNVKTYHLTVGDGHGLQQKSADLRIQFPVILADHGTSDKHIIAHRLQARKNVFVHKQDHRKQKLGSQRQGIYPVYAHIALYLKGERLADRLTLQVNVIVQAALLNIVKFIFPVDSLDRLAGQVKHTLHPEHKGKVDNGSSSCIDHQLVAPVFSASDFGIAGKPADGCYIVLLLLIFICHMPHLLLSVLSAGFHIQNTFFFALFRGINALVYLGDLMAPAPSAAVIQLHHILAAPMEIVGQKRHFLIHRILGIEP